KGVTVHHDGKPVPSLPHIAMSVAMLREAGVDVDDAEPNTWRVYPGVIRARDWAVEPDLSNAAVFLAAAAITGGRVTVAGWRAYADHRMATAGALIGLAVPGVEVDDIDCTTKTIPDFAGRWAELLSS